MKRNLIAAEDLAGHLGIKTQTVYLWVRQKKLPFYRVGRLVKFDLDEVLAHFKVEAEREQKGAQSIPKRTGFIGRPIDPFRLLRKSESSLTPEQRKRYEDMLKPK